MSRTQYYTATSLDGFIATEDDSIEWLHTLGDPESSSYPAFIADVGALAMGASTYAWMRRHEAEVIAFAGKPWPYTQPTWVFTHRILEPVAGADVRFVQGDVRLHHADMVRAAAGRNVWVVGGGELAAQFHDAGLLHEVIVQVASLTLGRGKPLFPRAVSPPWRLREVQQRGTDFVELRYDVTPADAGG